MRTDNNLLSKFCYKNIASIAILSSQNFLEIVAPLALVLLPKHITIFLQSYISHSPNNMKIERKVWKELSLK